jgi:hypothetical protein
MTAHAVPVLTAVQTGKSGATGADQANGFVAGLAAGASVIKFGGAILIGAEGERCVMADTDETESAIAATAIGRHHDECSRYIVRYFVIVLSVSL